jgi:hypothetical protein
MGQHQVGQITTGTGVFWEFLNVGYCTFAVCISIQRAVHVSDCVQHGPVREYQRHLHQGGDEGQLCL